MLPTLQDVLSCGKYRHENNSPTVHWDPKDESLFWLKKILEYFPEFWAGGIRRRELSVERQTDTLWGNCVLSTQAGAMPSLPGVRRWGRQHSLTALRGSLSSALLWISCAGANGKGLEKQPERRALWSPAEEVVCAQRTHRKSKLLLSSATDTWCLWQRQNEMAEKIPSTLWNRWL